MLTNNNGRFFWSANLEGAIENICNHFVPVSLCNNKYFHSRSMSGALAGVSLLGVLGGLLPQYDLRAWETARLEVKIFWRRFTNCDRRLKIQVHTVTNTITHCYKSYYVLTQIKVQTWNLSKILHRRIFRLKNLHCQFHLISTVLVRKTQKNEWKWRN